jgi:hypothetical protein
MSAADELARSARRAMPVGAGNVPEFDWSWALDGDEGDPPASHPRLRSLGDALGTLRRWRPPLPEDVEDRVRSKAETADPAFMEEWPESVEAERRSP